MSWWASEDISRKVVYHEYLSTEILVRGQQVINRAKGEWGDAHPQTCTPPLWYGIHVSLEEANILIPQLISYHINLHNKYKSGKLNRNNNVIMTWESEINIKAQGHSRFRRKITPFREHTFLASGPTWKRIASCILIARCWERRGKHYPSPQMMMKAKLKSSHPY